MKIRTVLLLTSTTALAVPQAPAAPSCDSPPPKGYNSPTDSGIFNVNLGALGIGTPPPKGITGLPSKRWEFLCTIVNGSAFPNGPEYPKPGIKHLTREGTGPYKSHPAGREDASLLNHTIFAPITPPPPNVKLPVIVFGEGSCAHVGTMFPEFLAEVASHGYLILANGPPGPVKEEKYNGDSHLADASAWAKGRTYPSYLTRSIDWVLAGNAAKYGNIDTTKIAAMGQSCGGLEAYTASYKDDRIKLTILLNSGVVIPSNKCFLKELKSPVALFLGGPCDTANPNGIGDYDRLNIDKFKAHLDTGHLGTYGDRNGGKFGKAVVSFLEWQFRGNEKEKLRWSDPKSTGSFVSDGWYNVTSTWFPAYASQSEYFNDTLV